MKLALAGAMLLAALTTEATAQTLDDPPIGSRLGKRLKTDTVESDKESALTAQEFASCLVSRQERDVHALLTGDEQASESARKRLNGEVDCLSFNRARNDLVEGFRVAFPADLFRGMLAEQWLKQSGGAAAQLMPLPLQRVYQRPWFARTYRDPVVDEMGACIADVNPAGILSLLRTEPYSPDERAAFAGLNPTMARCLRAGAKLQANRQALRAALAEGLYQRVRAPALSTAAVSAAEAQPAK